MRKDIKRYIAINSLGLAIMTILSIVYFIQPSQSEGLGINELAKAVSFGAMVFTFIVIAVANAVVYVIHKFDLSL